MSASKRTKSGTSRGRQVAAKTEEVADIDIDVDNVVVHGSMASNICYPSGPTTLLGIMNVVAGIIKDTLPTLGCQLVADISVCKGRVIALTS